MMYQENNSVISSDDGSDLGSDDDILRENV